MFQVVRRTVLRAVVGKELWNGNRESLEGLKFWRGDDSILGWAWTSYPRTQARYRAAMSDARFSNLTWHWLRTRRDCRLSCAVILPALGSGLRLVCICVLLGCPTLTTRVFFS